MRTSLVLGALLFTTPLCAERITVQCTASQMQADGRILCEPAGRFALKSDGPGTEYEVTIGAPASHCAPIAYLLKVNTGSGIREVPTLWLEPGESDTVSLGNDLARGARRVEVLGIGRVGGCNTGQMHSWAADIRVTPQ